MPFEHMNEESRRRASRTDFNEELPIVYNGKSAKEWYHLYCQQLLIVATARTFVTESYRPEPKHDAERFDELCRVLGFEYDSNT